MSTWSWSPSLPCLFPRDRRLGAIPVKNKSSCLCSLLRCIVGLLQWPSSSHNQDLRHAMIDDWSACSTMFYFVVILATLFGCCFVIMRLCCSASCTQISSCYYKFTLTFVLIHLFYFDNVRNHSIFSMSKAHYTTRSIYIADATCHSTTTNTSLPDTTASSSTSNMLWGRNRIYLVISSRCYLVIEYQLRQLINLLLLAVCINQQELVVYLYNHVNTLYLHSNLSLKCVILFKIRSQESERRKKTSGMHISCSPYAVLIFFRFLWPQSLDDDFIAAVFDVGAKSATYVSATSKSYMNF